MTAKDIFNGYTGNRATIIIIEDATNGPKTGVAYNASGLSISYRVGTGTAVAITLTPGNWFEIGGGKYYVDVADSVYESGNLGVLVQFYGALTSSSVYGEQHRVVAYNPLAVAVGANTTTPPTASANADATLSGLTSGPTTGGNWPSGSFGRQILIGSLTRREVAVTGSNHVAADIHAVQTGAITGDGIAASAVTKVAAGVWSALTSGFSVGGSAGEVVKALASMLEFVSGAWRWVANSLSQAPTGGGGDGIYARTFVVSSPSGAVSGVAISVVGTSIRVVTDTSGTTAVNLDAGTYTIRFGVPPGFAQQADLTLAVAASGSTSVSLTPVSVPAPPSANSCLLSVYVRNQSTEPADGITVTARLPKGWDVQGNTFSLNEIITDVTDSAGLAQLYLMRSTKYELSFSRANGTVAKIPIEIPDAATANLSQVYTG